MYTANSHNTLFTSAYTPYGFSPASASVPIAFAGEPYDVSSRGYLLGNGYRLYLPSIMRFASPDNISPFTVISSYSYCGGDPANYNDPSGHYPIPPQSLIKIFNKTKFAKRLNAYDARKAAALDTYNQMQYTRRQITNYQSPTERLIAEINSTHSSIGMAESYDDWREYSRYRKVVREQKRELKYLPEDSPDEILALKKRVITLHSEFVRQMDLLGLPANDTGLKQLEPINPMNIRQEIPLRRQSPPISQSENFTFKVRPSYQYLF
ncbi:RHS repeat-associated core domain-containing protein [Pseudomonas sp. DE0010]|uniref:RHS repeat-associated core domain-containing protein n=1 Tax=Pseudomonas sp. DE0010 TaxID=2584951 RepID=UPI0011A53078|nr:RHS repeat-associated core domain-containing protein [Pseudomonas sp. DE0010]